MKEVKVGSISEYKDHLSWVETFREFDMIILHVDIDSIGTNNYEAILYEYSSHTLKPMKRWRHTGNWRKGYQLSFDMDDDYQIKEGIKYLLTYVFYIQNIGEVRYHAYIEI